MNPHTIATGIAEFWRVQEGLLQAYPELAEDQVALRDMTEGLTNASDLVAILVRKALDDAALADALKIRMRDMADREARISSRGLRHRIAAQKLMEACDLRKVEMADFTASVRAVPPKVEIDDEAALPDALCKTIRSPDRAAIKEALATGAVTGAHLTNGSETLSIRTK